MQVAFLDKLLRHNPSENYKWAYTGVGVLPHDVGMKDALEEQVSKSPKVMLGDCIVVGSSLGVCF